MSCSQETVASLEIVNAPGSFCFEEFVSANSSSLARVGKVADHTDSDTSNYEGSTLVDQEVMERVTESVEDGVGADFKDAYSFAIPVKGVIQVGRHERECQLQIKDLRASSVHFRLWVVRFNVDSPPFTYLADTSKNGTFVNKLKVGRGNVVLLNDGDEIEVIHGLYCRFRNLIGHSQCFEPNMRFIRQRHSDAEWMVTNKKLGEGSFGAVHYGLDTLRNKHVAVKIIKAVGSKTDRLKNEAQILMKIHHPNIVQVYETHHIDETLYIFEELFCGGDLFSYLLKGERLSSIPEIEALFIVYQILQALKFLHNNLNVIHRDIKLDNVLLEAPIPGTRIAICDFGIAKSLKAPNARANTIVGTIEYSAPEVFAENSDCNKGCLLNNKSIKGYNSKCDLWSLGIMTSIMLSGVSPFLDENDKFNTLRNAKSGNIDFNLSHWNGVSLQGKSFVDQLLKVSPFERNDVSACLNHPWIVRRKSLLQKKYQSRVYEYLK